MDSQYLKYKLYKFLQREETKKEQSYITISRQNYKRSDHMLLLLQVTMVNGITFSQVSCFWLCQHMKHKDFDLDASPRSSRPLMNHLTASCSEAWVMKAARIMATPTIRPNLLNTQQTSN